MALVLNEVSNRKGETKRFDVVRAEEGPVDQILADIPEGQYKVLDGSAVATYKVSYRTVQDIEKA